MKFDSSVQTNLGSWGFEGITGGKCCVALCFCAGHNTLPWKCVLCKGTWHVTFSCFVTRGPSLVQQKIRCLAQSGISVMNVWGLVRSIFAVLVVTILRVWLLFKWMKETWMWRKNNYSWGGGKSSSVHLSKKSPDKFFLEIRTAAENVLSSNQDREEQFNPRTLEIWGGREHFGVVSSSEVSKLFVFVIGTSLQEAKRFQRP